MNSRKSELYREYDNSPDLADEDIVLALNVHNNEIDRVIDAEINIESNLHILDKMTDYKMSVIRLDFPSYFLERFRFPDTFPPSITLHYPNTNYDIDVPFTLFQTDYAPVSQGGNPQRS
jgi:hypothetical protein